MSSEPSDLVEHAYIVADLSMPRFWTSEIFGKRYLSPHRENNYSSKIDVLVNCAGMSRSRLFIAIDLAEIEHTIDTNLKSLVVGTRYFLRRGHIQGVSDPEGRKQSPVIISVSSLLGLHGGYGAVAYAASKAGVLGFTRALATETGSLIVRVNTIVVETGMKKGLDVNALIPKIPLKRFGRPEEIASAALFLDQNQYTHNCVINLDGGLSAM